MAWKTFIPYCPSPFLPQQQQSTSIPFLELADRAHNPASAKTLGEQFTHFLDQTILSNKEDLDYQARQKPNCINPHSPKTLCLPFSYWVFPFPLLSLGLIPHADVWVLPNADVDIKVENGLLEEKMSVLEKVSRYTEGKKGGGGVEQADFGSSGWKSLSCC